jgi:hypothetical protein
MGMLTTYQLLHLQLQQSLIFPGCSQHAPCPLWTSLGWNVTSIGPWPMLSCGYPRFWDDMSDRVSWRWWFTLLQFWLQKGPAEKYIYIYPFKHQRTNLLLTRLLKIKKQHALHLLIRYLLIPKSTFGSPGPSLQKIYQWTTCSKRHIHGVVR